MAHYSLWTISIYAETSCKVNPPEHDTPGDLLGRIDAGTDPELAVTFLSIVFAEYLGLGPLPGQLTVFTKANSGLARMAE